MHGQNYTTVVSLRTNNHYSISGQPESLCLRLCFDWNKEAKLKISELRLNFTTFKFSSFSETFG